MSRHLFFVVVVPKNLVYQAQSCSWAFPMSDTLNDKKIEQKISAVFNAFFQLILSSEETKSSEIISDNNLQNGKESESD